MSVKKNLVIHGVELVGQKDPRGESGLCSVGKSFIIRPFPDELRGKFDCARIVRTDINCCVLSQLVVTPTIKVNHKTC